MLRRESGVDAGVYFQRRVAVRTLSGSYCLLPQPGSGWHRESLALASQVLARERLIEQTVLASGRGPLGLVRLRHRHCGVERRKGAAIQHDDLPGQVAGRFGDEEGCNPLDVVLAA